MALHTIDEKRENWSHHFLWLEGAAYFFASLMLAGMYTYAATTMAGWGFSTTKQASVLAFVHLPAYLKMLSCLASDRFPILGWGRRKPYVWLGMALSILSFTILIFQDSYGPMWIAPMMGVVAAALIVDGTLDGLTVDVTPPEKAGIMQGSARAGYSLGLGVGYLMTPRLGLAIGWTATLVLIAIFTMLQAIAVLCFRETPITRQEIRESSPLWSTLRHVFARPVSWLGLGFALLFMTTSGIAQVVNVYLLTELGWNDDPELLKSFGTATTLQHTASFVGALLFGGLIARFRNRFGGYLALTVAAWILIAPWLLVHINPESIHTIYLVQCLYGFGSIAISVMAFAVLMRLCPAPIEGFMFALYMSLVNLGVLFIAPVTITRLQHLVGGLIPAFFSILVYTVVGLVVLRAILVRTDETGSEVHPPKDSHHLDATL